MFESHVVGVMHPGQMGAAIARVLRERGATVRYAGHGRSEASRRRADDADLEDAHSVADLAAAATVLLSVVPPDAALDVATATAATGYQGIYVDANAISPTTATKIAAVIEASGARYVDASIIGPPPGSGTGTRLYLSGASAEEVAPLFSGDARLVTRTLGDGAITASALKVCFAAWSKISSALLIDIWALAGIHGVQQVLRDEWTAEQQPSGTAERLTAAFGFTPGKAWRFAGEFDEIAAAFAAAGLPTGFATGAAELARRLETFKDREDVPPELVVEAVVGSGRSSIAAG